MSDLTELLHSSSPNVKIFRHKMKPPVDKWAIATGLIVFGLRIGQLWYTCFQSDGLSWELFWITCLVAAILLTAMLLFKAARLESRLEKQISIEIDSASMRLVFRNCFPIPSFWYQRYQKEQAIFFADVRVASNPTPETDSDATEAVQSLTVETPQGTVAVDSRFENYDMLVSTLQDIAWGRIS